jgi:TPR repeat protein
MKKTIIILTLILNFQNINAQTCDEIRSKAVKLEQALTKEDANTYYEYGKFLATQIHQQTGCINAEILNTYIDMYDEAANLGHLRAATRMTMIFAYGLYGWPNDPPNAYVYSFKHLVLANEMMNTPEYKEYGWITPMFVLKYAKGQAGEDLDNDLMNLVFNLLIEVEPLPISETDRNSDVSAKKDYYKTVSKTYLEGNFNVQKNVALGLKNAYKVDQEYGFRAYKKYAEKNPSDASIANPAVEMFLAAYSRPKYYSSAIALYNAHTYYLNEKKISSLEDFKRYYNQIKEPLASVLANYQNEYPTIESKWDLISKSRLKDPEAYENWKFLPKSKQDLLYNEAKSEDQSSMKDKERFQILRAKVENGENEALLLLAKSYLSSSGVILNGLKAAKYFEKALDVSYFKEEAAFNLARMYDEGELVDQNWELASVYYKIANGFDASSYRYLGEMHLFGVGGLTKSMSTAKDYFTKAMDLGDFKSELHLEILRLFDKPIKPFKNDIFTVRPKSTLQLAPRVIRNEKISHTIKFDITEDIDENFVRFFITNPKEYKASIKIGTYNPSPGYTKTDEHEVIAYPNTTVAYRDIGIFFIQATVNDIDTYLVMAIPEAICYYPKDN